MVYRQTRFALLFWEFHQSSLNVVRCAIWYHLYNLKSRNLKTATLLKLTLLHGCFSRFLSCRNGTKSHNAPQIFEASESKVILGHVIT